MNDNTINNDVTMGGASATLLANRYRVVRQLGQGGMGSVWLAEDTKLDGHKVAIKMLPSILVNNKRAYAQVKAEALVSLKLVHPNIVQVRAFEDEGGNPFLVMDYIDGQTLDDYLAEKGKLSEEETIRLLKPVAAALDYAHTQGVVHRDVKPGNVMIDKSGHPYVLDFGIAREIQETMTRVTGKLSSGTLMYMSPEQLNGDAPKPAQDIYSFAAVAYECLAGCPPFTRGGIEDQIKHKTPEALGPQFIKCGLSVMSGLAKPLGARPATCVAVLSVGSRVPRDRADDGLPARRTRIAAVLLGALAIGVLVGGGWWWQDRAKAEGHRSAALSAERAEAAQDDVVNVAAVVPSVVTQMVEKTVKKPIKPVTHVVDEPDRLPGEIIVNLTKDGKIVVNGCALALDELQARLVEMAKFYPGQRVHIRADKDLRYDTLVKVMDTCTAANIWNLSLSVSGGNRKQAYQAASNAFERARQVAMETSKPKVTLKAMLLNGEEINATVVSGLKDKTRKTPVTVDLSGWRIGSTCEFELSYVREGVSYKGKSRYVVREGTGLLQVKLLAEESSAFDQLEIERRKMCIYGKWKALVMYGGERYAEFFEFCADGKVVVRRQCLNVTKV